MRKRMRMLGALATVALLLTGCSGIPSDGPVRAGQPVEPDDNPPPVFLPSRPEKDATPESIVRGFIDAASSPEDNYLIAREFLTTEQRGAWDPNAGVTIDDGSARPTMALDDRTMQLSVNPVAEVDATGVYDRVDSSAPVFLRYRLAQVGGQWRISEAPPGIVMDRSTFSQVFSAQALYFYDPGFRYLVPDLRWYPRGPLAPTRIVKGLLAGPSPWLVGAVTTAFPSGTDLIADAVQVIARDAKVDLNSEALSADAETMQRMQEQLENSLPTGLSASITINQNSQDIGNSGDAPSVNPRVDARALILREGSFGFLAAAGEALTTIPGISESVAALNPRAVTLSPGQTLAAVLGDGGVHSVAVGDPARLLDPRQGLVPPSIDTFGYVWSVPSERPGELFAYSPAGNAIAVPTPWPEATTIHSLRISRDGTRLAALVTVGAATKLVVAAVTRDKSVPAGLGELKELATIEGTPLDASWVDELTVASLSQLPNGDARILAQQIGGVSTQIAASPGTVSIAGGNTLRELRALSAEGNLQVQRGVGWQVRIGGVDLVATQQGIGG